MFCFFLFEDLFEAEFRCCFDLPAVECFVLLRSARQLIAEVIKKYFQSVSMMPSKLLPPCEPCLVPRRISQLYGDYFASRSVFNNNDQKRKLDLSSVGRQFLFISKQKVFLAEGGKEKFSRPR